MKCFYCVAEKGEESNYKEEVMDASTMWQGTPMCARHAAELLAKEEQLAEELRKSGQKAADDLDMLVARTRGER